MPQVDKNRRPSRGLNLAERHVQKHLPDTPQMLKLLKEEMKVIKGEYHVIPRTKPSEVI